MVNIFSEWSHSVRCAQGLWAGKDALISEMTASDFELYIVMYQQCCDKLSLEVHHNMC